jgi:hypothetical protein
MNNYQNKNLMKTQGQELPRRKKLSKGEDPEAEIKVPCQQKVLPAPTRAQHQREKKKASMISWTESSRPRIASFTNRLWLIPHFPTNNFIRNTN